MQDGGDSSGQRERRRHGYETARPDIQVHVPRLATRILEVGCSTGALGRAIKARQECLIVGVEVDPAYASVAACHLDRVIVSDVESVAAGPPLDEGPFDCLIAADVLEHLVDPWATLKSMASQLVPGGIAIVSLPNVLYWPALRRLLVERSWPRDDQGVFDRTHLRWFTERDAVQLLEHAGMTVRHVQPNFWAEGWTLQIRRALARTPVRAFSAAQFVIVGQKV